MHKIKITHWVKLMVGEEGLEPSHLTAHAPKACVYTNFTTRPFATELLHKNS